MANLMIFGARFIIYLTFLLMFTLFFRGGMKEKKAMIVAILSIPVLMLIIKVIHIFYFEPRPFITYNFSPLIDPVGNASFPSVHASVMAVLTFPYFYFKSKWALFFLFLMLWVGVSRIYVGVHYPLDIFGGFIVGVISIAVALFLANLFKARI